MSEDVDTTSIITPEKKKSPQKRAWSYMKTNKASSIMISLLVVFVIAYISAGITLGVAIANGKDWVASGNSGKLLDHLDGVKYTLYGMTGVGAVFMSMLIIKFIIILKPKAEFTAISA